MRTRVLALAAGASVLTAIAAVAPTGIAGAQAVSADGGTVLLGAGQAASSTFHLELHLPETGGTPLDITQDFAITDGKVTATTPVTSPTVTRTADGSLTAGTGLLETVLGQGAKTATANDSNPTADTSLAPNSDLGGIGAIGALQASAKVTSDPGAQSNAQIASLQLGLTGPLAPVATALSTALNTAISTAQTQLTSGANSLVTQLSALITQLQGLLPTNPITSDPTAAAQLTDLQKLLADLPAGFTAVSQQIQDAITKLGSTGGLLDVGLIQSSSSVTKSATAVTATSTAKVGSVSALGGLGSLGLIQSTSTATATGVAGGAKATVSPDKQVLDLKVGSLADISAAVSGIQADLSKLDPAGLSGPLQQVAASLNSGFQTLLTTLNGALGNLGVSVADLGETTNASADGTSATATSKGVGIQVTLPPAIASAAGLGTQPLLVLSAVPTSATAQAEINTIPAAAAVATPSASATPAAGAAAPKTTPATLAYPGGDLPLTGGIALGLGAAAAVVVLRRRVRSTR
jgi:hypothetical protein